MGQAWVLEGIVFEAHRLENGSSDPVVCRALANEMLT